MLISDEGHVKVQMDTHDLTAADWTGDLGLSWNDLELSESELERHRNGEAEFELNESDLMNAVDMGESKRRGLYLRNDLQ